MSQNRSDNGSNGGGNGGGSSSFWKFAAAVAGVSGLGGALYLMTRGSNPDSNTEAAQNTRTEQENSEDNTDNSSSVSSYLSNLLQAMDSPKSKISRSTAPSDPVINNLNALLSDIYVRYIALKDEEFQLHYNVFTKVFGRLHETMKEVDSYYQRYSSKVQFAGSHYDKLRIKKPDEFDMDIVIGLPLNLKVNPLSPNDSDIQIEHKSPGYVQLKMGVQFQRLPMRDGPEWLVNRAAYEWKDDQHYLLRSNFINWFKSVVNKALNKFDIQANQRRLIYVDGVPYTIRTSESGPAVTLIIENASRGFRLDVDLVPALKFGEQRWPICRGYRDIPPGCNKDVWMVVPKPNKAAQNQHDMSRSWRVALHDQERQLMYDTNNLRQAIRLIKKLRDAQGMDKIASYYIKTLFFWEIIERNDSSFWSKNNPATIFKIMVRKFHAALAAGNIPYFWHKNNNLIGHVNQNILKRYEAKLTKLIDILDDPSKYKLVAKYLLTPAEFSEYNDKFLHV